MGYRRVRSSRSVHAASWTRVCSSLGAEKAHIPVMAGERHRERHSESLHWCGVALRIRGLIERGRELVYEVGVHDQCKREVAGKCG